QLYRIKLFHRSILATFRNKKELELIEDDFNRLVDKDLNFILRQKYDQYLPSTIKQLKLQDQLIEKFDIILKVIQDELKVLKHQNTDYFQEMKHFLVANKQTVTGKPHDYIQKIVYTNLDITERQNKRFLQQIKDLSSVIELIDKITASRTKSMPLTADQEAQLEFLQNKYDHFYGIVQNSINAEILEEIDSIPVENRKEKFSRIQPILTHLEKNIENNLIKLEKEKYELEKKIEIITRKDEQKQVLTIDSQTTLGKDESIELKLATINAYIQQSKLESANVRVEYFAQQIQQCTNELKSLLLNHPLSVFIILSLQKTIDSLRSYEHQLHLALTRQDEQLNVLNRDLKENQNNDYLLDALAREELTQLQDQHTTLKHHHKMTTDLTQIITNTRVEVQAFSDRPKEKSAQMGYELMRNTIEWSRNEADEDQSLVNKLIKDKAVDISKHDDREIKLVLSSGSATQVQIESKLETIETDFDTFQVQMKNTAQFDTDVTKKTLKLYDLPETDQTRLFEPESRHIHQQYMDEKTIGDVSQQMTTEKTTKTKIELIDTGKQQLGMTKFEDNPKEEIPFKEDILGIEKEQTDLSSIVYYSSDQKEIEDRTLKSTEYNWDTDDQMEEQEIHDIVSTGKETPLPESTTPKSINEITYLMAENAIQALSGKQKSNLSIMSKINAAMDKLKDRLDQLSQEKTITKQSREEKKQIEVQIKELETTKTRKRLFDNRVVRFVDDIHVLGNRLNMAQDRVEEIELQLNILDKIAEVDKELIDPKLVKEKLYDHETLQSLRAQLRAEKSVHDAIQKTDTESKKTSQQSSSLMISERTQLMINLGPSKVAEESSEMDLLTPTKIVKIQRKPVLFERSEEEVTLNRIQLPETAKLVEKSINKTSITLNVISRDEILEKTIPSLPGAEVDTLAKDEELRASLKLHEVDEAIHKVDADKQLADLEDMKQSLKAVFEEVKNGPLGQTITKIQQNDVKQKQMSDDDNQGEIIEPK
ncbi:unnamed protein product, partial [Didymodactylos carnosus]